MRQSRYERVSSYSGWVPPFVLHPVVSTYTALIESRLTMDNSDTLREIWLTHNFYKSRRDYPQIVTCSFSNMGG